MSFLVKSTSYDLAKTLKSGQMFRYREMPDGCYRVISRNLVCYVKQTNENIYVHTGEEKGLNPSDSYWKDYFNFGKSHDKLYELSQTNDFLHQVVMFNEGLRILQQDPWESLVSFIISQQKRIPQIQSTVEKLCEAAGTFIGGGLYAFPTPYEILSISISSVKLGYREGYIKAAAEEVSSGRINLERLRSGSSTYKNCLQQLCSIRGVGVKVANCVALFSLGHTEAFPVDVHIQRILELPEMQNFSVSDYDEDAGLLQQYLFNYALAHGI